MKQVMFTVVCIALSMGQTCTGPAPELPAATGMNSGLYSGQVNYDFTDEYTDSEGVQANDSNSRTLTITRNFGASGLLLNVYGTPVEIGQGIQLSIGPAQMTLVLQGFQPNVGRLMNTYSVTGEVCDNSKCATSSGFCSEVYTQTSPNTIDFQAEMNLGYTDNLGGTGLARSIYNGTLTK